MTKIQYHMKSKVGSLYLVASTKGLCGVFWSKQAVPTAQSLSGAGAAMKWLKQAVKELEEYLGRKRKNFDVPLDFDGTPFQKSVWQQLARIPYGGTFSYTEIAKKINKPKAVRAVGTANARNPLCIIVPCHRVIAADGTLGGYSGGLKVKTQLLEIEAKADLNR